MILAGDVGGTKTVLALYDEGGGALQPLERERFASAGFESLESIIEIFLARTGALPSTISVGVAGPVLQGEARVTNLPWVVNAAAIERRFGVPKARLLNDLQAIATAVPHLGPDHLVTLNTGIPDPTGTIGVIAPGTGLGMAFLAWTGSHYRAFPTEGGHASFSPRTDDEVDMLCYLQPKFGHVSFERVCSGSGLPNVYDYLLNCGDYAEPDWLRDALDAATDPTPVIVDAGLANRAEICTATVDMFVQILGGVIGNFALKVLATGGIFLGGGIPPRILSSLRQAHFLAAMQAKGRFAEVCASIPVHVILDPDAALYGAAWHGLETA